jgi:hypothetical protein
MAATQVFMTGKWALVGGISRQPKLSAKAIPVGISGSVYLVRGGIHASVDLLPRVRADDPCRQYFSDDARRPGST